MSNPDSTSNSSEDASRGTTLVRFRSGPMEEAVRARQQSTDTSPSMGAKRDLQRYYRLIDSVRPTFSEDEAHLLVDVFTGTLFDPIEASLTLMWASLADAEGAYYEKHAVDKDAFVERVRELSVAEVLATIDAIERFWNAPQESTVQSVGLAEGSS